MNDEVKEKAEQKEPVRRTSVSVTIPDVPMGVHNKIIKYRRKISSDRQRDFSMMEAYNEFLKEYTKGLEV